MDSADKNLVDLSALAPKSQQLKLPDGKVVDVQPPKVENVLRLGFLGQKMEKASDLAPEELGKIIADMQTEIAIVVPELDGVALNTGQLLALLQMITEMGMPGQSKILEKSGIEVNNPDPKE